ncbi:hypothetical protein [Stutzerimonas zhaodongensis]|uniref:hypothetical protein n=1 Tax=Stutzerimonas TaxID=2901164 RepID=UPI00388D3DE6
MRQGPLFLLFALCLATPQLQAQEAPPTTVSEQQAELEHRLMENQEEREALKANLDAANTADQAQLVRLRQENKRLRMQLEQEQAKAQPQPQLFNEQQQWFAVGGGVGVLGFLLGVLTTRGRRRRQWLN